jgi:hypothetical protein
MEIVEQAGVVTDAERSGDEITAISITAGECYQDINGISRLLITKKSGDRIQLTSECNVSGTTVTFSLQHEAGEVLNEAILLLQNTKGLYPFTEHAQLIDVMVSRLVHEVWLS